MSGPLLDRIDLHVPMPAVPFADLVAMTTAESSEAVRARVAATYRVRLARADVRHGRGSPPWLALDMDGKRLLARAHERFGLTARAHQRVIRVARTIADLAGTERIESQHVAEAIQYRAIDREPARETVPDT